MNKLETGPWRRNYCRLCGAAVVLFGGQWIDVRFRLAACPPVGGKPPLHHRPYPPGDAPLVAQVRAIVSKHQDRAWSAASREGAGQPHPPLDNNAILRTARYAFEHLDCPDQLDDLVHAGGGAHDALITELVVIYDAFRDDAAARTEEEGAMTGCARCAPSRPLAELGPLCPDGEPHKPYQAGTAFPGAG